MKIGASNTRASVRNGARQLAAILLLPCSLATLPASAAEPAWLGSWVLNAERSALLQPEQPLNRGWLPAGRVSTQVSIGGLPLPGTGGGVTAVAPATAPTEPGVLRTRTLTLSLADATTVKLHYDKVGEESLRKGTHRGIKTRWQRNTLSTSYRTTERRVAQSYQLQPDGSLLVTTTIKRKQSKKHTYKQIFERPGESSPTTKPSP